MDRRAYLATAGAVIAGGVAGCLSSGTEGEHDVGMTTRDFRPEVIEVPPGTTVTWRNTSGTAHTVTAYDSGLPDGADYFATGGFDNQAAAVAAYNDSLGGRINAGAVYEHTFEVEGEHRYYCIPHEQAGMIGAIVVTEDATPPE